MFRFKIKFYGKMEKNKIVKKQSNQITQNIQILMQRSGEFCDAKLHLDDGTVFNIHRVIMGAACSYLR